MALRKFETKALRKPDPVRGLLWLLLMASLAGNLFLYTRATRPLFEVQDRPLIERTAAMAAANWHSSADEVRANTFPIAMHHHGGRTCIELRANDGLSFTSACYDRVGRVDEESVGVTN